MEQYKKWLEEQIEKCLNDKDLQREHWAYCTAYRKLIEALPIHGVVRPKPDCPDCKGSGGVQTGFEEYSTKLSGGITPNPC